MKHAIKLFLVIQFQYSGVAYGQGSAFEGLWMIENVRVGNQNMTPVAKWTRIKADGTYESGNGWLKSSEGTWTYDEADQTFLPKETNGLIDPNGAFAVSFNENNMQWKRTEEGQLVTVTLTRIRELPRSPADKLQGLWDLEQAKENDKDITQTYDPQNKQYLFIRWDRVYMERTSQGTRQTGYWHMNAHKPEMTFISHNAEQQPQSWKVEFASEKKMSMMGISDSNKGQLLIYNRLKAFPQ